MAGFDRIGQILPGVALAGLVAAVAMAGERLQLDISGFVWADGIVIAMLAGALVHTLLGLRPVFVPGLGFAAKTLLEIAVVLLGTSVSFAMVAQSGASTIAAVLVIVVLSLVTSYTLSRTLGLSKDLAILVACGNSICGNSAIAAAAPVIGARAEDVAASISFTAALGVVVVLVLPLTVALLGLSEWQYGVFAGMTVYAVPQVLAATVPVGAVSAQVGTFIKLMRVLMLGPVVIVLRLWTRGAAAEKGPLPRIGLARMAPWFIIGFVAMMGVRSTGLLPPPALHALSSASTLLTVVSMAALGLSVNLRTIMSAGGRVLAAGALSILFLGAVSLTAALFLIH